ncbi:MAG: SRPBCC family protein, partial [Thermoanaerobaculales bacterium]
MKTLKKTLISILLLVALVVVIGFFLPRTGHVERSITIDAPPCVVFATVNGLQSFNDWSPFVALNPGAEYSYEGPGFGVGAKMSWTGESPNGETGNQEIVASTPYEQVRVRLGFSDGMAADATYILDAVDGGTRLTWAFDTDFGLDLFGRYFGLILDRQIGPIFAQGLTSLKRIAEALPKVDWSDIEIGISVVPSTTIAYTTGDCSREPDEIGAALATAYGRVAAFIAANGLQFAGPPIAIANYWDERGYGFDAGIPVSGAPSRGVGPGSQVRMG